MRAGRSGLSAQAWQGHGSAHDRYRVRISANLRCGHPVKAPASRLIARGPTFMPTASLSDMTKYHGGL
jgi:hypothetical protein